MTEQKRSRFWLISLGAHGLVGAILLLSPVGQVVFEHQQPERPEVVRRGQELATVIDDIRDLTVERLRAQTALLASAQTRMGQNFATLNAHYQPFAAAQAETARLRFSHQAAQTLEHQAALLAAAETAIKDPDGSIPALVETLSQHQARIITGQEGIRRSLHLLAAEREDLLASQKEMEEAQLKAFQFFRWSRDIHQSILRDRKRLAELDAEIETAQANQPRLAEQVAAAQAAVEQAQADEAAATEQEAKAAARTAKDRAHDQLRTVQQEAYVAGITLERLIGERQKIEERIPGELENRDNNLDVGRNIQTGVYHQQAAVVKALETELADAAADDDGAAP